MTCSLPCSNDGNGPPTGHELRHVGSMRLRVNSDPGSRKVRASTALKSNPTISACRREREGTYKGSSRLQDDYISAHGRPQRGPQLVAVTHNVGGLSESA